MLGTAGDQAPPLLGRDQEQTLLTSALEEVAAHGQALMLRGEPGIGKSRLLSETARAARERGLSVLTATGVQSEAHLPFAGLHQLLRARPPLRGRDRRPLLLVAEDAQWLDRPTSEVPAFVARRIESDPIIHPRWLRLGAGRRRAAGTPARRPR